MSAKVWIIIPCIILLGICLCACGRSGDEEESEASGERYLLKVLPKGSTEYASASAVDRVVKKHVTGEEVECTGTVGNDYTYVSKDRDMTFHVESTLQGYGGIPTGGSTKTAQYVNVKYSDGILAYYKEDIEAVLAASDLNLRDRAEYKKHILYGPDADLEHIAEIIAKADDIYKPEIAYNSKEFMERYYAYRLNVYYVDPDTEKETYVATFNIDGSWSKESAYEELKEKHKEIVGE